MEVRNIYMHTISNIGGQYSLAVVSVNTVELFHFLLSEGHCCFKEINFLPCVNPLFIKQTTNDIEF